MRNKKSGFTLIEIIGVVTILALILLVSVPALTKTLKKNEQKKYDSYVDNLKIATENYIVKQENLMSDITTIGYTYITIQDLIDTKLINELAINPDTEEKLSRDTRIKITKDIDGTFNYEVQPYYNNASDYNNDNLIIHYDSVKYSKENTFNSFTDEVNYNYTSANWTDKGALFDRIEENRSPLNNSYTTGSITISFSIKFLEDPGTKAIDYIVPLRLYNTNKTAAHVRIKKNALEFYNARQVIFYNNTTKNNILFDKDKEYTITFVQNGSTSVSVYINGENVETKNSLNMGEITYNIICINATFIDQSIKPFIINNILVYNKALTDNEVNDLYQLDLKRFGE